MTVTQPLRDEHKELIPHIETLRTVADSVGEVPIESLRPGVDEVFEFLMHHLIPHAEAEERALYPVVGRVLGAPEATAVLKTSMASRWRFSPSSARPSCISKAPAASDALLD